MKKYLIILLVVLSPIAQSYDGWSIGTIKDIRYQNSGILIRMNYEEGSVINPGGCGGKPVTSTDYVYMQQGDTAFLRNINAAALTAYAANKKVSLAITGCSKGGAYPLITEFWIQN